MNLRDYQTAIQITDAEMERLKGYKTVGVSYVYEYVDTTIFRITTRWVQNPDTSWRVVSFT